MHQAPGGRDPRVNSIGFTPLRERRRTVRARSDQVGAGHFRAGRYRVSGVPKRRGRAIPNRPQATTKHCVRRAMGSLRTRPRSDGPEPRQTNTLLVLHTRTRASVRDPGTRVVREPRLVARRIPPPRAPTYRDAYVGVIIRRSSYRRRKTFDTTVPTIETRSIVRSGRIPSRCRTSTRGFQGRDRRRAWRGRERRARRWARTSALTSRTLPAVSMGRATRLASP